MLGSQTSVVDGVRNTFPTSQQWNPAGYGPQSTGVPQVSPMVPPYMGGTTGGAAASGSGVSASGAAQVDGENVMGYGTAGNNALTTTIASENPHNMKVSPVWWAVLFMVVGILALHVVHFGGSVTGSTAAGVN